MRDLSQTEKKEQIKLPPIIQKGSNKAMPINFAPMVDQLDQNDHKRKDLDAKDNATE